MPHLSVCQQTGELRGGQQTLETSTFQVTPCCLYTSIDVGTERQPTVSETAAKAAGVLSVNTVRLVNVHAAERPY